MQFTKPQIRKAKCCPRWYPAERSVHDFTDNPVSSAVISPHAGFSFSGSVSMLAVSKVKKQRVWMFGTSHFESITKGISVYYGDYSSSIGKTSFPADMGDSQLDVIRKYFSDEGHRTDEHSIENVLYCLNHFVPDVKAFCTLVQIDDEKDFETISDDIAKVWKKDDSIIVSTDWNHFVPVDEINELMNQATDILELGSIKDLYRRCKKRELEACGVDGLYLANRILSKVKEKTNFNILQSTDSSRSNPEGVNYGTCVGYIAACN
jgi:AmmeMemoRadiSam system protein B